MLLWKKKNLLSAATYLRHCSVSLVYWAAAFVLLSLSGECFAAVTPSTAMPGIFDAAGGLGNILSYATTVTGYGLVILALIKAQKSGASQTQGGHWIILLVLGAVFVIWPRLTLTIMSTMFGYTGGGTPSDMSSNMTSAFGSLMSTT